MIRLLIAVAAVVLLLKAGMAVLGMFARPVPKPPPPGEMRRVNLRYRCVVCGAEVKMVSAPDDMPPPPRHCVEEMEPVESPFE
jgi:hypothetical protein